MECLSLQTGTNNDQTWVAWSLVSTEPEAGIAEDIGVKNESETQSF